MVKIERGRRYVRLLLLWLLLTHTSWYSSLIMAKSYIWFLISPGRSRNGKIPLRSYRSARGVSDSHGRRTRGFSGDPGER